MNETKRAVASVLKGFILTNDSLARVRSLLLNEFNNGLSKENHDSATVKMFITYMRDVPDGSEHGKFLALDLGGTNFRVLSIDLDGQHFDLRNEIYEISQSTMVGSGEELFDHIAECLAHFLEKQGLENQKLPLGFTFSFPCLQKGLSSASLVSWTKGFECSGVEDKDVVQLLREAVVRRGIVNIDVVAVLNDTLGTLMSCAHRSPDCRVGIIIGTGTNACYMEDLENVKLWTHDFDEPSQVMINTEWGAFGDNGCLDFLRTDFDVEVDKVSVNAGKQLFEKMISGMYMGEIARQILVNLINQNILFDGYVSERMKTVYGFKTKYVSYAEKDPKDVYTESKIVLQKMGIIDPSDNECEVLKMICACVSTRAAHLVSAALATILNKMKRPHTTVGVDGSVFRYHPNFKGVMEKKTTELTNPEYTFELMLSEDGSGRGAALVAAVAARNKERRKHWKTSFAV